MQAVKLHQQHPPIIPKDFFLENKHYTGRPALASTSS